MYNVQRDTHKSRIGANWTIPYPAPFTHPTSLVEPLTIRFLMHQVAPRKLQRTTACPEFFIGGKTEGPRAGGRVHVEGQQQPAPHQLVG